MAEKKLTRREFIRSATLAGVAVYTAHGAFAMNISEKEGGESMVRFGDVIIPAEEEGKEKHVPQIEAPAKVKAGEPFEVTVIVGKEVPHPNTIEHHIKWIQVYAKQDGPRPVVHVGTFDLGPTYAEPKVTFPVILPKSSALYAIEYCNIHGVWDNSVEIEVE
jgi:superoxide reductase